MTINTLGQAGAPAAPNVLPPPALFPSQPSDPLPPPPGAGTPGSPDSLLRTVKRANETAQSQNIGLRYGIHEASGEFYLRVIDTSTNKVVKSVPSEDLLDFRAALEKSIGILFDRVA